MVSTERRWRRHGVVVADGPRAGQRGLQRLHQGVRAQSQAQAQLAARLSFSVTVWTICVRNKTGPNTLPWGSLWSRVFILWAGKRLKHSSLPALHWRSRLKNKTGPNTTPWGSPWSALFFLGRAGKRPKQLTARLCTLIADWRNKIGPNTTPCGSLWLASFSLWRWAAAVFLRNARKRPKHSSLPWRLME